MSNPFMAASPQQPASPSSEEIIQALEKKVEMLSAQLAKALELYQLLEMENARLRKINAFQAEQIATLEEQLRSNSRNSNRPPSSDPPFPNGPGVPSSKKSRRSAKKKNGHRGTSQRFMTPTAEYNRIPEICPHCGGTSFDNLVLAWTAQHIELPTVLLNVIHEHLYRGHCTQCGANVTASVPLEHRPRFGVRLSAVAAWFDTNTGTTRRQLQEFLRDVLGLHISQGGIQNIIDRTSSAIEPVYEAIAVGVRKSPYNHVDETSWRTFGALGKNLHWLWVLGNRQLTYFRIDPHRSAEAFQALLKDWSGYLISDDYGVYRSWAYGRQTCLAHLIREARNLSESTNHDTACCGRRIKKIFQHICELAGSPPAERVLTLLRKRFYRVALDFGHLTGRAEKLIMRMINEFSEICLCLRDPRINSTNNFAERQIRSAVCQRKISIGSASEKGERWIERSLSVRKTCALQKKSYFEILVDALKSYFNKTGLNLYWIHKAASRAFYAFSPSHAIWGMR